MKKGSYTIQESVESGVKGHASTPAWATPAPRPADTSFTACILTLLFFFGLCIIVLLAAWPWGEGKPHTKHDEGEDNPVHEGFSGGKVTPAPTTDKITNTDVVSTTVRVPVFPLEPDAPETDKTDFTTEDYDDTTTSTPTIHHETFKPSKGGSTKGGHDTKGSHATKGDRKHAADTEWVKGEEERDKGEKKKERLKLYVDSTESTAEITTVNPSRSHMTSSTLASTNKSATHFESKTDTTSPMLETTTASPSTVTPTSIRVTTDSTAIDPTLISSSGDLNERILPPPVQSTCLSPVCKSLSARMLAYMNHSARPCENFYDFACGGMRSINSAWIKEVPKDSESWERLSDMIRRVDVTSPMSHRKFRSFYESCLYYNEHFNRSERIKKAREAISSVGKFYSSDDWVDGAGILTEVIGKLLKYHFTPLLDIILDVDSQKSSKFALKLTAPVFKSPFGDLRENEANNLRGWPQQSCVDAAIMRPRGLNPELNFNLRYEDYIKCSINYSLYTDQSTVALQELDVIQYSNKTREQKLIRESVINMDILLGKLSSNMIPNEGEKRKTLLSKEYSEYTIKELKEKFPLIDWKKLIEMLLEEEVAEDALVQVYFESYFKALFEELGYSSTSERRLVNSLMVMFSHELYYGLVTNRQYCNRRNYCLKVSRKLMDDVSSALFLKSYGLEKLQKFQTLVNQIYSELILSFKSEINKMTWMDAESQTAALEKAQHMRLFADGGMSVFLNDTYLDSQLHEYPMNSGYLENAILLLQRYRKRMYSAYKKDPSDPEQIWSHFLLPFDNQGKVIYGMNAIAIPFGLMSKPFFSEDYPTYVQMANLGIIIAHEIWHHFDTAGIKYDAKGSKKSLLSQPSKKNMDLFSECIAGQYSTKYEGSEDGLKYTFKLNTSLSLNERLADLGASHLAYSSLWGTTAIPPRDGPLPWSSMTPQQLFFLSMAQNHCSKSSVNDYTLSIFENEHLPPFKRVNDIALNSPEFRKAFSCSIKAPCKFLT